MGTIISFIPYEVIFLPVLVALVLMEVLPLVPYRIIIRWIAIICLAGSSYLYGEYNHQKEVAETIQKIETQTTELNAQIEELTKQRNKVIYLKGKTITEYVDKERIVIDRACKLSEEFVNTLNEAAK